MLGLMCGNIGEGKTLFLVYLAWKLHIWNLRVPEKYRVPIFCNFKLMYGESRQVEVSELLDLEGLSFGYMPLQELYTWLESRASSSLLNRYCSYFIFQSRKRRVDVMGDAQLGSTIDLRFYELAHIIGLARNDSVNRMFTYQFAVRSGAGVKLKTRTLSYDVASMFWDDYNTEQPQFPLGIKQIQFEVDKYNPKKMNKVVDDICNKLLARKRYKKAFYIVDGVKYYFSELADSLGWVNAKSIYRYQIEDILLRTGDVLTLAPYVTNRLKTEFTRR